VTGSTPQVSTSATANGDAITVNRTVIETLPIFDDDAVATISQFLDVGSNGTGGVSLLVNGMEVNSLDVSTSAIQQIKTNENARPPGVPRNSLEGAGSADLDLRLSRDVPVGGAGAAARTLTLSVDAFNVLNTVNYFTYMGTVTSPLFGQPVSATPPREIQFSARMTFWTASVHTERRSASLFTRSSSA